MPTLVLFERSFASDSNVETNRVVSFVLQFIESLHSKYYNEQVAVHCLSLETKSLPLPTFTTHTPTLINSVITTFNTPPNSKSYNLRTSLEYAKRIVVDSFGAGGCPVQTIILTDGTNPRLWELISERDEKKSFESFESNLDSLLPLPSFPIRLHVILCGTDSTKANIPTSIPLIVRRTNGSFSYIPFYDSAPLSLTLSQFIDAHYPSYEGGTLACGHLQSQITLYPNPNLNLWEKRLPSVLSVIGLLPNKKIMSTPIFSRHAVLPLKSTSDFSLPLLLNEVLKNERSTAIIKLADDWFALLNHMSFITSEKETHSLTLSILPLHLTQMVSCDLSTLMPLPQLPTPSPSKEAKSFHPSYNPPKDSPSLASLKPDMLATDYGKLLRLARSLPSKLGALKAECARIKHMGTMFAMPELAQCAGWALREVWLSLQVEDIQAADMLKDVMHSLSPPEQNVLAYRQPQVQSQQISHQYAQSQHQQQVPVHHPSQYQMHSQQQQQQQIYQQAPISAPVQIPLALAAPTIVIPHNTPTPRTSVMSLNNILNQ
eukprot:TRINITY_DN3043_c0_g3_i2.p1 TRINITY_DN3043_c0_g3~~TRINITY_DN3043_c0_g3_i2.p1  ORF type:complete len:545 (-),score=102.13 TRINITY_DN3043_c0_g3_i2:717-2351(-)